MCEPLHTALEQGRADSDKKVRQRWAELEAAMIHFVENGRVTADLLKQLQPPKYEHWELRNRRPKPSLRVFGRFALPNVFVGTHVKRREELSGMWSAEFEQEKLVCEQYYAAAGLKAVFSAAPSFEYSSYITENATATIKVTK